MSTRHEDERIGYPAAGTELPDLARSPAGRVLHAYLAVQHDHLLAAEGAVHRREDDGIHDLRVALRRSRTSLASYGGLVDRSVTDPLRDEMRWVSHTLGSARDAQVVQQRLQVLLGEEVPDAELEPARGALREAARADDEKAARVAQETLGSERYRAVVERLRRLLEEPPWTELARRESTTLLPKVLDRDLRRVERRVRRFQDADDDREHPWLLHEVRKSTKRLRYACEAAGPVLGARTAPVESAAKRIQSLLGDYHDTVLTRSRLLELADTATSDAAPALRRLHAREEAEAARLELEFADAWDELSRWRRSSPAPPARAPDLRSDSG